MKILITSSGHIRDLIRQMLLELWARNIKAIEPDIDVLYIDSSSPVDAAAILAPFGFKDLGDIDDDCPIDLSAGGRFACRFPTPDWGHRSNEGGRAVRKGLKAAIDNGYDYVFYWESDVLISRSVRTEVEKMARNGVKVTMPLSIEYHFCHTELCVYECNYLRETGFVDSYNWHHDDMAHEGADEQRRERAHRDVLYCNFWRGRQNDQEWVRQGNFLECARMSDGSIQLDWISHCADFTLYLKFLQINGVKI